MMRNRLSRETYQGNPIGSADPGSPSAAEHADDRSDDLTRAFVRLSNLC